MCFLIINSQYKIKNDMERMSHYMNSTVTLIIVLIILVILSAYFSATETAFSSLNRIRLKNMAAEGNKKAALALSLSEDYDRMLSTILIGNNIVNIASASIATVVFTKYFMNAGVTISTVVMTIVVLIFGEISPKSLAKEAPESFAMFSAPVLKGLLVLLRPVNFLFAQWKKMLSHIFKISEDRGITEEELLTIVNEAQQDGGINEQEGELIRSAIEFNDLEAVDILTPRIDVEAVDINAGMEEIRRIFRETRFSRLPVYEESVDDVIGILYQKDFYQDAEYNKKGIRGIMKPAVFVHKSMKISKMLKLLQQSKSHIAVVTDEFGGTMGIVTLEDIIEELVGEIWDEHDEVVEEFKRLSDDSYRIMCGANLDKMAEYLGISCDSHAATVSGWVVEQLGKIPEKNDRFQYEELLVTVTKTSAHRVVEILIKREDDITQQAVS